MIGGRPLALLATAVVTAVVGTVHLPPGVEAQTRADTTIAPPPRAAAIPLRRLPADDPAPSTAVPRPPNLGLPLRGTRPGLEPASDGTAEADDEPSTPGRSPAPPRDGDLADLPLEPVIDGPVGEGLADGREPEAPIDGLDPALNDQRDPSEVQAFQLEGSVGPPEMFLFPVEFEPILDRRPQRLFRFEPYEPIGIRAGGFVVLPEVEIGGLWSSNVEKSRRARADTALELRPSFRVVSDWRRHAIELRGRGGLAFFDDFSSEDERSYTFEARGRLDVTRRTRLEALVSRDVAQESRSSIDAAPVGGRRADISTDRVAAALTQRFNRLTVQLRGSLAAQTYDGDETLEGRSTGRRRDRDVSTAEQAVRASWVFKPTLVAFVETAINQRAYKEAQLSDGLRRDSNGERYRLGIGFGTASRVLSGEASLGYGRQRPDDRRLDVVDGLILDANVAYRISALTSFLATARSEFTETTLAGSAGALARQVGLEVRHAFRRELIATAGVGYTVTEYAGTSLTERELAATLGLEYALNRETVLFSRYQHTLFTSTASGRGYEADEVRLGLRLRR